MSNLLFNFTDQLFHPSRVIGRVTRSLWLNIVGLSRDFWKDGNWQKTGDLIHDVPSSKVINRQKDHFSDDKQKIEIKNNTQLWHAQPGEISEKMWGIGSVTPFDDFISESLIRPLGINKDMSLLDLSAGLGARLRKTTDEYKVYINGLEPDPDIAARGMAISAAMGLAKRAAIEAYDPNKLSSSRKYDCIIARETIYRVADQKKFIKSIVDCCKPKAQVSFTDYIVNPEMRDRPTILAWYAYEKGANPMGLVEIAEAWARAGISLRVHEDLTEQYKKEVKAGLIRFTDFMHSGVKPDSDTKKAIEKRIITWAHRMAAFDQGLKFYRFYGLR